MKLSLPARALLALVLTIGFYALAFAIMAALAALAYEGLTARVGFGTLKLALFCGIGIVTIFFSILPRREEFRQPGPLLDSGAFPELFREIGAIADKAGQAMPAEVYLLPDLNAYVSERGGFLGLGRVRSLGVGLPLLQILTQDEFRAVLAHEFGHYHGGDTFLGPWIYRVRAAMARTVEGLGRQSVLLRKPFEWYGTLFLRVTLAISRYQELAADRLAASLVGAGATISGLRKAHAFGALNGIFWREEIEPAIRKGFRPSLAEGFRAFLATPAMAKALPGLLEGALAEERADPYDTHPPLEERLRALGAGASARAGGEDKSGSAWDLIRGCEALEPALYGFLLGINPGKLEPLEWEDAGEKVHRPALEAFHKPFAPPLAALRFQDYPAYLADPAPVAARLKEVGGVPEGPEEQRAFIARLLEAHLALALLARGWTLRGGPGEALACRSASGEEFGFGSLRAEAAGPGLTADAWLGKCRTWGLA